MSCLWPSLKGVLRTGAWCNDSLPLALPAASADSAGGMWDTPGVHLYANASASRNGVLHFGNGTCMIHGACSCPGKVRVQGLCGCQAAAPPRDAMRVPVAVTLAGRWTGATYHAVEALSSLASVPAAVLESNRTFIHLNGLTSAPRHPSAFVLQWLALLGAPDSSPGVASDDVPPNLISPL